MTKILNINKGNSKRDNVLNMEKGKRIPRGKPLVVIEFSWQIVLFLAAILGLIFFGEQIFTMLLFLFISLVVMSSVLPIVGWFVRKKIPRGLAIVITYTIGILLLLAIVSIVVIPFIGQLDNLVESIPLWIKGFVSSFGEITIGGFTLDSTSINKFVLDWFEKLTLVDSFESIAGTVGNLFSWTTLVFAAIVFSIYLVLDHDNILDFGLIRITSDEKRKRVKRLVLEVENKLGKWLLGQATVSSIAGTLLGFTLALFGVPFALPIGVFIALLSTIPTLGATFASVPPLLISLIVNGPLSTFVLLLIFVIYQQIENNFIIPKVMGNAMGIRPIILLFTAITFLILFGVWGAVLAVPAVVIIRIFYEFYIDLQKLQAKGSI